MPSNGIQVGITGEITPTAISDTFPVTNPYWGLGGLRNVTDLTDRNAISVSRREAGMLVYVASNLHYYKLEAGLTNVDWTDLGTSLGGSPSNLVVINYSSLMALVSSNNAVPGTLYNINDRADLGITVEAIAPNRLNHECFGSFLNADYQNIYGNNLGVWWTGLTGIVAGVSVVIVYGTHFKSITGVVGTNPNIDTINWQVMPKLISTYVNEVDVVYYDFDQDMFTGRKDKRYNVIETYPYDFQFGSDKVMFNSFKDEAYVFNPNIRGYFSRNNVSGSSYVTVYDSHDNSYFANNSITNSIVTITSLLGEFTKMSIFNAVLDLKSLQPTTFRDCFFVNANITVNPLIELFLAESSINRKNLIIFDRTISFSGKQIDGTGSTFDIALNAAPIFLAGVLTLPAVLNYIGRFTLTGLTGQTITKILNVPQNLKVKFMTATPNTLSYTVTSIASAVANHIIGSAVGITAIIGRNSGSDFIEFEKSGSLNQRTGVVKAV